MTTAQALAAGVTKAQLRTLAARGWSRPARGVLIEPEPADGFRARLRAALLVCSGAAACGITAARLHELWGLPIWRMEELPHLIVPAGRSRAQRRGMRLYFGLDPADLVRRRSFPCHSIARTVADLSCVLLLDQLVCLIDSALRKGWGLGDVPLLPRQLVRIREAHALADARSESPLETLLRLLLVRAGLVPKELQFRVFRSDGVCFARLDMAWPSIRLAVEADGREHHDDLKALYGDRVRQNQLVLAGWTVLRFTWFDVTQRPFWVVAQVRQALLSASV